MQTIHKNVTVLVTQREFQARAAKTDGSTTALQYVVENAGFDIVTFRVDFSESSNIKLHRPAERSDQGSNALQRATQELAFECELRPFERCILAYVIKKGKKRAFVRVHYEVIAAITPSVDLIIEAQERMAMALQRQLQRSRSLFSHVSKLTAIPCQPRSGVDHACAEINRYFRNFGDVFVDASFPPTAQSIYSSEAADKISEADSAVFALCSWEHLHHIADSSWSLLAPKTQSKSSSDESESTTSFTSGVPSQDSFLCALSIIAPYCEMWFYRWFPSLNAASEVENMAAISVALCTEGLTWQHIIIDLFFPCFPLGQGLMTSRNINEEIYATLLHKAYAKLKGSYSALVNISTVKVLQELTGYRWGCIYRCSGEGYAAQSNEQEQLQHALQNTRLSRRQRRGHHSPESDTLVIATLGKIDNHHRAFLLTIPSDQDSLIVLHDDSEKYLRDKIAANLAEFDRDQDPAELRLSFEQLIALDPKVWSLSLSRRHERRLRRVLLHQNEAVKMTTVISVPSLTTIAFSCTYLNHKVFKTRTTEWQEERVDLSLSVALVEADFSYTTIEDNKSDASTEYENTKQVVRTLGVGEYVVTVSATRPDLTESHPLIAEEGEPASDDTVLTPATIDENLQLAFDCLDREGKYELSESDIDSFLQLHEHVLTSQNGKEALLAFMHQHGSSTSPGSEERRLTLDDFRELYIALAAHDCSSPSIRARFEELVWQDLLYLLPSSSRSADSNVRTKIDCRESVEIVCCFHSDEPLLNVITLADVETNNFNM